MNLLQRGTRAARCLHLRHMVLLLGYCLAGHVMAAPAVQQLIIASATNTDAMQPLLEAFESRYPAVRIDYREYQTRELYEAQLDGSLGDVDLVISSAMDLQVDLVNRGFAQALDLPENTLSAQWAEWRQELFGFTYEPVVMIYNRAAFAGRPVPGTRSELASALRDDPDFYRHAIGTYDIELSGVGYLFASQDLLRGYQFGLLLESIGRSMPQTYCCSTSIHADVASGKLVLGYNIISSYVLERVRSDNRVGVQGLSDYTLVMSRSVFVPRQAPNPEQARDFVAFVLSLEGQQLITERSQLISLHEAETRWEHRLAAIGPRESMLPIRLGPALIGYLDPMKRRHVLHDWHSALGSNTRWPAPDDKVPAAEY